VNKKEVDKIISLKQSSIDGETKSSQVTKNESIDGYDVKTVTIDPIVINKLGKDKIYIAESELFTPKETNQLLHIDTLAGKIFCSNISNKVKSSYAKGIVNNVETYKMSVGLSNDIETLAVEKPNFPSFLLSKLFKTPLVNLTKIASFDIKTWCNPIHFHLLYWGPLVTTLCFYLLLNGYFYFKTNNLEQKIGEGGQQISEIISQKRELDVNSSLLNTLSNEFNHQNFTHNHWQVVDKLLMAGMKITGINFKENKLTIRGTADKASDVLQEISNYEQISSSEFQGPVRKSRGQDSFILNLQLKDSI
jgi:hypothetical protein